MRKNTLTSRLVLASAVALVSASAAIYSTTASAQSPDTKSANKSVPPYVLTEVFKGPMSDPALKHWEMVSVRLDIVPGGVDPSPHRHDGDNFVYVLEGEVEVELDGHKSTYKAGEMFHEPRNITHSLLRNTSAEKPASVLAMIVIKPPRKYFVPVVKKSTKATKATKAS